MNRFLIFMIAVLCPVCITVGYMVGVSEKRDQPTEHGVFIDLVLDPHAIPLSISGHDEDSHKTTFFYATEQEATSARDAALTALYQDAVRRKLP